MNGLDDKPLPDQPAAGEAATPPAPLPAYPGSENWLCAKAECCNKAEGMIAWALFPHAKHLKLDGEGKPVPLTRLLSGIPACGEHFDAPAHELLGEQLPGMVRQVENGTGYTVMGIAAVLVPPNDPELYYLLDQAKAAREQVAAAAAASAPVSALLGPDGKPLQ